MPFLMPSDKTHRAFPPDFFSVMLFSGPSLIFQILSKSVQFWGELQPQQPPNVIAIQAF